MAKLNRLKAEKNSKLLANGATMLFVQICTLLMR